MSILHVSLLKFPLLLLGNAEGVQTEEFTACLPEVLMRLGIFGQNCLPTKFCYSGHWEEFFGQKGDFSVIQQDATCVLHPCPGLCVSVPRTEATDPLWLPLDNDLCAVETLNSVCACSGKEQAPRNCRLKNPC